MPDMQKLSTLQLPDHSEYYIQDDSAIASISRSGNTFTATKRDGSTFTFTQRDIVVSSSATNPNKITISDNDGNTYDVDIIISDATQSNHGLMSASDKVKIDGIESGAEVNQLAFSKIRITKGSAHTDLDADTKTDTLELIEGDNITLTPSAVSDAVTIYAKDTIYTLSQDATDGHIIILTNNDESSTDHVQTITIPDNNTTYTVSLDESTNEIVLTDSLGNTMKAKPSNASTSLDGFMSKNDKSKLDGIASGAEVNQNAFSNVAVDDVTISADNKTDTLTFIAGSNITITPNATTDSITISSSYTNTTYELTQDATDGHKFTLSGSNGYTKTITIPDNNTTYTLSVGTGTDANQIVFTPSSGSATKITVPYATKALQDADGNVIKDTYAASFSISDHTITLKNKSGVSLGTVTVPDNNTTYTFAEGTTNKAFSVTPSGGSAQSVPIHGLGSASEKNYTTSVTSGSADLVTSGAVASAISTAIDNLPEPMIFKGTLGTNGTITALPTASSSNEGWTYKVITAGTYASQAAKVGDMFVSTKIGSAYQWVYIPSGDDVEDTWRNIKVNGAEKLGTGISSGAVDFVDGDFINITYANNKITVSHADTSSQASVSNSGRTYIQSITLDGAGHVTKLTSAAETVVNTDRYVNSAKFADDTTASASSPIKMTLTRAGSDTATVTANVPKVSASSAGVAPKGASVSSQSQSTKFLREDGTWSAPSYTVNTDTKVTSVGNHYSPTADTSAQLSASASGGTAAWSIDVVQGVQLQRDAKGHVVGVTVTSGKIPANPNTNYYHKTGSWSGLTYTAGKVGSPDDLAFTIPTGTSATTVAVGNHTHSTTIATSTGTNQLTLSHGGKYAITTGGTSFVFTMPTDNNTDTNVTQTATNTNANYEVLFSGTADNTTRTEGARKYSNLTFNPSTGTLTTTKVVSANATLGVADIDTANITEDNVGNLIVTGAARFLNTINGSISGNAATATSATKATQDSDGNTIKSTYLKLAGGTLTGTLQLGSSTQSTLPTCGIRVHDVRNVDITTNCMRYQSNFFFSNRSMPDSNFWSLLHVRGWNEDGYNTWELAGPANSGDQRSTPLYVRSSNGTTWGSWRKIFDSSNKPTKADVGLGNVDNTADANKSVNYATSAGSATKATQDGSGNVITSTYLKLSGGTLTGELINQQGGIWVQGGSAAGGNVDRMTLTAGMPTELKYNGGKRGLRLYSNAVAIADPYNGNSNSDAGWIRHIEETSNSSIFEIATGDDGNESIVMRQYNTSSAVAREAKILGADGATSFPVSVTAPKFIGNLQGTADNADKVDGYHMYYDRYVTYYDINQPTANEVWYVLVKTNDWNSNIEVIQVRTQGDNRTGSHVIYTGSRGTKWWGYGQVYSHRGLSGVRKYIGNADCVYLRFDKDCTKARIYTSFTAQSVDIVTDVTDGYTEVPTYGGWYGNQITVDHIQTNNYITIQKQTVASSTFADTNPKIVFKSADGSQNGSLTWTDYDSVQSPASLTLNGNQGGEYFIAPNIKATGNFYGTLSGTASHSNALNLIASNEIRFGNRPSSAVDVYFNYQWADGTASAMINKYVFMNGNKTKCPVEASKFIGPLQGNADTATTATTATNTNYLISNSRMDYGWNGVNYFNQSANAGNGVKVNDNPTTAWWHIMRFNHGNNAGYYTDLAVPFNDNSLYYKRIGGGALQNGGWVQVSDALNVGFTYTTTVKYYTHNRKFQVSKSTSAWDAQAYSQSGYVDNVFVTFKPNQTNMAMMVGLNTDPTTNADYGSIDYALYCMNNGKVSVYESGTEKSVGAPAYASGDEFRIEYSGGYVRYYHNGTLLREVARAVSGKLYMDSSFHGATSCIYDVSFGVATRNATYALTATTATKANSLATEVGTSAGARPVWYSYLGDNTKAVYDTAFTYNPSGGILTATKFVGSLQGNADTATKATQDGSGNVITSTYVIKTGDTMTGPLVINGVGSSSSTVTTNTSTSLAVGGTATNIASTVFAPTRGLQIVAGTGSNTGSTAIGFHNPNISSASFGYYNSDANNGLFRYMSDDTYWYVTTGSKKLGTAWRSGCFVIGTDGASKAVVGYLSSSTNGVTFGAHNSDLSAWDVTNISGSSINFRLAETTRAKLLDGCLSMFPSSSNYREGIRIHSYGSWSDIVLCGDDNTGDAGTTANSWFLGNNNGNFYIMRNGSSSSASAGLACVSNAWSFTGDVTIGNLKATILGVNASNGSSGGISLYAGTSYVDDYGICFRSTSNKGKHGYVTSDWATYFTMSNTDNRGWVFRRNGVGNVASINTSGNMVLNGSLTLGGNEANTSGCRLVYSSLGSVDFVFV